MPFTFKLAKRLALSKAVRTTAARALSALRQVSTHPALVVATPLYIAHAVPEKPIRFDGILCRSINALAPELLS
jgi:hypothetical protein